MDRYIIFAIVASILAAIIGALLNIWFWKRKQREPDTDLFLEAAPMNLGQLEVIGGGPLKRWVIEQSEITIGRNPNAEIHLDSPKVSRRHAVIKVKDNKFYISDCGSTNGTVVNGIRITNDIELHENDTIKIVDVELSFSIVRVG